MCLLAITSDGAILLCAVSDRSLVRVTDEGDTNLGKLIVSKLLNWYKE